ncbi:MAG: hypothetical protein Q8904_08665, partial [Bacteroidota bacterium]|nr:hypothetical protein [Bacteroidota bacterium]
EVGFSISETNNLTPEYSIRIVKVNKHYELEARILDRNLLKAMSDYELSVLKGNERGVFSVGTFTYIIPITDSLKSRIVNIFNKVITFNDESARSFMTANADGTITVMVYDGPIYRFRVCENEIDSHKSIGYPLASSDFRTLVIRTNLQIIEDLRNKIFDESGYIIYK